MRPPRGVLSSVPNSVGVQAASRAPRAHCFSRRFTSIPPASQIPVNRHGGRSVAARAGFPVRPSPHPHSEAAQMTEMLWSPSRGPHRGLRVARLPGLAGATGGSDLPRPRRPLGVVGRGRGPVLGLPGRLLQGRLLHAVDPGAHRRPDAAHPVVPRRTVELGPARAPHRGRRGRRAAVRPGGRPARARDHLRRAAPVGGRGGRVAAPGRRASRRPGRGLPAEHRARGDRVSRVRRGRRGAGRAAPRTSAPTAPSVGSRSSNPPC